MNLSTISRNTTILFLSVFGLHQAFADSRYSTIDELSEIPESKVIIYGEHRLVARDSFGVDGEIQLYSLNNDTEVVTVIHTSSEEDLRLLEEAESQSRTESETYEILTGKNPNFEIPMDPALLEKQIIRDEETTASAPNDDQYDVMNDDMESRTSYCNFTKDYDERPGWYRNKCYDLTVPYTLYAYEATEYKYHAVGMRAQFSNKTQANIIEGRIQKTKDDGFSKYSKAPNSAFTTKVKVFTPAGYYSVVSYKLNIFQASGYNQLRAKTTYLVNPALAGSKHHIIVRGCNYVPYFCF